MQPAHGTPNTTDRRPVNQERIHELAAQVARHLTVTSAVAVLSHELARILNVPLAILSRDEFAWRFEAQAFPEAASNEALAKFQGSPDAEDPIRKLQDASGHDWTAITLGTLANREWALLLPGESTGWANQPDFDQAVQDVQWSLGQVANRERDEDASRFQRRLHAFTHRLARETDTDRLNSLVLKTLASQVRAQTGALATFDHAERALAIVATLGYPFSLVEHLRIAPGEGLLGRAYESGKAIVKTIAGNDVPRRLRYRTDSYMVLPVREGNK